MAMNVTRTLKARVGLDGMDEYKRALSELNSGNRVLASEMRKLQAEYKGNTESVEYLTKRGELLERQLLQQKDKVATLREAVAKAARTTGEASQETQSWIVKLNNAEAAEMELQHEIDDNNKTIEQQGTVFGKLTGKVEELAGQMGIKLPPQASNALKAIQGLSTGSVTAFAAIGASATAVVAAIKALHENTLQVAADVDEIITESMVTGLSTQTIQQFKYAENLIDVSYSTITSSLTKLTRSMASARDGNAATADTFKALGVSITDASGNLRSSEDVFYDVVDALGNVDNATERDALAMEILGKSAQELNPLIIQGSDALRELGEEAEETGYVLDESQIKKLGEVDDAYQRSQLQLEALKKELAADFAPASREAMELFVKAVKWASDMLHDSGIITGLASILESIGGIIETTLHLITDVLPGTSQGINQFKNVLSGLAIVMATIADAANVITGLLSLDFERVGTSLGFNKNRGQASNLQTVLMQQQGTYDDWYAFYNDPLKDTSKYGYDAASGLYYDLKTGNYVYGNNATGNDNWRGGLTWVGENGPELVALPSGSRIASAQDSRMAGGIYIGSIVIDAHNVKEFTDIIDMVQSERIRARMGVT